MKTHTDDGFTNTAFVRFVSAPSLSPSSSTASSSRPHARTETRIFPEFTTSRFLYPSTANEFYCIITADHPVKSITTDCIATSHERVPPPSYRHTHTHIHILTHGNLSHCLIITTMYSDKHKHTTPQSGYLVNMCHCYLCVLCAGG